LAEGSLGQNQSACALGLSLLLSAGCTVVGKDAEAKAVLVENGATEADVLRVAGPPTRRIEPSDLCKEAGGNYELTYEVNTRYVGGWLSDTPMSAVALCFDATSRVVSKIFVQF
jgi:hypothetical protein